MECKDLTEKIIGCTYLVRYEGEIVGEFIADLVVEDIILLERKSVRRILVAHEIPLVNDLVATGKPVSLVLNSGERKVEETKGAGVGRGINRISGIPSILLSCQKEYLTELINQRT